MWPFNAFSLPKIPLTPSALIPTHVCVKAFANSLSVSLTLSLRLASSDPDSRMAEIVTDKMESSWTAAEPLVDLKQTGWATWLTTRNGQAWEFLRAGEREEPEEIFELRLQPLRVIAKPSSFCFFFYRPHVIVVGEERNRGNWNHSINGRRCGSLRSVCRRCEMIDLKITKKNQIYKSFVRGNMQFMGVYLFLNFLWIFMKKRAICAP
jgi:hypothetical protein